MNRTEAGMIVGRLHAHYPSIAANDLSAQDWVNAVVALDREHANRVADALIAGWTKDRAPRLSDWQETARQQAQHRRTIGGATRYELEEAAPAQPERLAALIAEAKRAVSEAKAKARTDVLVPRSVSKYDKEPVFWGMPGTTMTPGERAEQLAESGGRRVRRRSGAAG